MQQATTYWTSRNPTRARTRWIVVHHAAWTYAPGDAIRAIWQYHKDKWPRFNGIGYHLTAQREADGSVGLYQTNPLDMIGVGVYGRNTETVHLCLAHNFTTSIPGDDWLDAAIQGLRVLRERYPDAEIAGHKEITVPGWESVCPGNRWNEWKPRLLAAVDSDPQPALDDDIQVIGIGEQPLQREAFVALCRDRQFGMSDDEARRVHRHCEELQVDARFIAATALVEHDNAPMRSRLFQATSNAGSRKRRDPEMRGYEYNGVDYIVYEAPYQGFYDLVFWYKYFYGFVERVYTVRSITRLYAPGDVDGNVDPALRTARMITDMQAMLERNS